MDKKDLEAEIITTKADAYNNFYSAVKAKLSKLHEFNDKGVNHYKEDDVLKVIDEVYEELNKGETN